MTHRTEPVFEGVDPHMVEVLRAMTPRQRLQVTNDMWRSARTMLIRWLSSEHPDRSAVEIEALVAERMSRGTG